LGQSCVKVLGNGKAQCTADAEKLNVLAIHMQMLIPTHRPLLMPHPHHVP